MPKPETDMIKLIEGLYVKPKKKKGRTYKKKGIKKSKSDKKRSKKSKKSKKSKSLSGGGKYQLPARYSYYM